MTPETALLSLILLASALSAGALIALVRRLAAMDLESERKADAVCRAIDRLGDSLEPHLSALEGLERAKQQMRVSGRDQLRERIRERVAQAHAARQERAG